MGTKDWKEFKIKDLFDNCVCGIRITVDDRIEGVYPFVTTGEFNEGVNGLVDNDNKEAETFSNALTIDMFGNCFYYGYKFKCDDNILVVISMLIHVHLLQVSSL